MRSPNDATEATTFRILSLDGGGIMGTYSAAVLSFVEQAANVQIADYFDLVTGTSTGGLIALALAMGVPATRVLTIYREHGPRIFPFVGLHRRIARRILHLFRPKWSQERLGEVVHEIVGDRLLKDAKRCLVVPSFACTDGSAHLFRTPHHPSFAFDRERSALSVGLSTSAAPTFFQAFTTETGRGVYLDGGVWANCPALVGIVEAVRWLGVPPDKIKVLSIGVTQEPYYATQRHRRLGGIFGWNVGIIALLMQAQMTGSLLLASELVGDRLLRIDTVVDRGRFRLDDASQVDELMRLGKSAGEKNLQQIVDAFLGLPASPPKFFP
jgi:patatin-like phospholipase/acyl hydrolase